MLILLPPSETKRAGGDGAPWDASRLALAELTPIRESVIDALVALSDDPDAAARVLKLGPKQRNEIEVNRALRTSPTMPALDRYTGVLFDALDASNLDSSARRWLGDHVLIHSAPFGPVGALDPIPSYRLGAGVRLPGLTSQRSLWADPVAAALDRHARGFVLDLRSEAYVALGAAPVKRSAYVRVLTRAPNGETRALNHFNKSAKGRLTRALAQSGAVLSDAVHFVDWASEAGIEAHRDGDVVTLIVPHAENLLTAVPQDR